MSTKKKVSIAKELFDQITPLLDPYSKGLCLSVLMALVSCLLVDEDHATLEIFCEGLKEAVDRGKNMEGENGSPK